MIKLVIRSKDVALMTKYHREGGGGGGGGGSKGMNDWKQEKKEGKKGS